MVKSGLKKVPKKAEHREWFYGSLAAVAAVAMSTAEFGRVLGSAGECPLCGAVVTELRRKGGLLRPCLFQPVCPEFAQHGIGRGVRTIRDVP